MSRITEMSLCALEPEGAGVAAVKAAAGKHLEGGYLMSRDRKDLARRAGARSRAMAVPILLGLALSACALGRSVVDVQTPTSRASTGPGLARISEVRDLRKFEAAPRDPSTPSLGDAGDINDPGITARAIARKRNSYGAALGDFLLPEGTTVADLVRRAAEKALQDAGYTVVDEKSPNYAKALPLALDVDQFWAWFTPGFFLPTVEFKSLVTMKGDALVGRDTAPASGTAAYDSVFMVESDWTETVEKGLADLSDKMRERIRPPAAAAVEENRTMAASDPPTAAAARPAQADINPSPAVATLAPTTEMRRTGVLVNDLQGRWISYADYALNASPTPPQQQALLNRCNKSYSTFSVQGSKLVADAYQDADVRRSEYPIIRRRSDSLLLTSDNGVRDGAGFTNVSFAKDRGLTKFGLSPDVLVFEPRSPQGGSYTPFSSTRNYARCPVPAGAAVEKNRTTAASDPPTVAADARPTQADIKPSPAVATLAPTTERRRTGVLVNDMQGRWISYADYTLNAPPTPAQQQALLNRCNKSYSTFRVQGSKLVIDAYQDADVRRSEYPISSRRSDSLVFNSDNGVRGPRFTSVFFAKDREPTKFGLSPDVLVFDPRSPQVGSLAPYSPPRNYARCPVPAAAAE
jgi:hypothetical protein